MDLRDSEHPRDDLPVGVLHSVPGRERLERAAVRRTALRERHLLDFRRGRARLVGRAVVFHLPRDADASHPVLVARDPRQSPGRCVARPSAVSPAPRERYSSSTRTRVNVTLPCTSRRSWPLRTTPRGAMITLTSFVLACSAA